MFMCKHRHQYEIIDADDYSPLTPPEQTPYPTCGVCGASDCNILHFPTYHYGVLPELTPEIASQFSHCLQQGIFDLHAEETRLDYNENYDVAHLQRRHQSRLLAYALAAAIGFFVAVFLANVMALAK
jgi:hypothetical protein